MKGDTGEQFARLRKAGPQPYLHGVFAGTNNLAEVIGGSKPMAATRDEFNHDGCWALRDARRAA